MKKFLEAGKVVGTHGLRGELRVQSWCKDQEAFCRLKTLYFDDQGRQQTRVVSSRPHKNIVLTLLQGVASVEAADALRGRILYACRDDFTLEEGEHFVQDLIGLRVEDADSGALYGALTDVLFTGANDVYQVTDASGKNYLLPAIPLVVIRTDVEAGVMAIRPIKGIFEDAD